MKRLLDLLPIVNRDHRHCQVGVGNLLKVFYYGVDDSVATNDSCADLVSNVLQCKMVVGRFYIIGIVKSLTSIVYTFSPICPKIMSVCANMMMFLFE